MLVQSTKAPAVPDLLSTIAQLAPSELTRSSLLSSTKTTGKLSNITRALLSFSLSLSFFYEVSVSGMLQRGGT